MTPQPTATVKTIGAILPLFLLAFNVMAQDNPALQPAAAPAPSVAATNVPPPAPGAPAIPAATNLSADASNRIEEIRRALQQSITNRLSRDATSNIALPALQVVTNPPAPAAQIPVPAAAVQPGAAAQPGAAQPGAAQPGAAQPIPSPGAGAQPPATEAAAVPEEAEHLLKFNNAPPDQILEKYAELTSRVVLRPASLPAAAVTIITSIPLTRKEAIEALDGALALNGITMVPQGDKFVKAVPSTQVIQEGAAISKVDPSELPDAEQFVTHVVQLKTVKPTEVAQVFSSFTKNPAGITAIDSSQILVLRDYASNIKRMVELIEQVDVPPASDYLLEVIPIKYGKVLDLYDTMSALISGAGGAVPSRAQTQRRPGQLPIAGQTGQAGQFGTTGRTGSRYGRSAGFGQQYGGVQQQQLLQQQQQQAAAGAGTSFQGRLNQILSRAASESTVEILGDARIVPHENSNSLIVYANKQDIQMITNIVAKVDVLLAQVLIEGIVLSVTLGDDRDVGVSFLQERKRFGDAVGAGGINSGQSFLGNLTNGVASALTPGFSYFGRVADDYQISLAALEEDRRVRILQRPRLQTSHAVPGSFFTGSTVPYVTGFYDYGFGTGVSSRSTVEQVSVGVTLQVTPFITPDGLVVMDIFQDISSLGEFRRIDQNDVPTTTTRNAEATLSVRDGDTIMLGGYIEDNKSTTKSGVPILKDIPGLGMLFRSKTDRNKREELILLLRVTVLKSPADAGAQAEAETQKLPGVFEADKQFKKEEQKRLRKSGSPQAQQ